MGNFGLRIRSVPPLDPEIAARVVSLTLAGPPADATHWTLDVIEGEVIGQCM